MNPFGDRDVARRYDAARELPASVVDDYIERLRDAAGAMAVRTILDLGCGTGRFTASLASHFGCRVIGVDPSPAMLERANAHATLRVEFRAGTAEAIPLGDAEADIVFLSQVIHHLPSLQDALREIARVSAQGAMLAVRQSTRESNSAVQWTAFFPEAAAIDRERVPARDELVATIERSGFETAARLTVRQLFATSYDDYVAKIAQRGLSPLIAISDDAFESGLQRLRIWAAAQPRGVPVFEPIDYLLFRNSTVGLAVRQPVE